MALNLGLVLHYFVHLKLAVVTLDLQAAILFIKVEILVPPRCELVSVRPYTRSLSSPVNSPARAAAEAIFPQWR